MAVWFPKGRAVVVGSLILVLILLGAVWVGAAGGGFTLAVATRPENGQQLGEILVNGTPVIRIRTAWGGYDSAQRAQVVKERLEWWRQAGLPAEQIVTGYLNGSYTVKAGELPIVTVDEGTAAMNGCSPPELALIWANNLRRVLGAPLLAASAANLGGVGGAVQTGVASWYGPGFHGRGTANGEIFDQNALTAAHRTLPFGTRVQVTNLYTGKSVVVRINDRGPFIKGRTIDLSRGAARVVGLTAYGIAPVELRLIKG